MKIKYTGLSDERIIKAEAINGLSIGDTLSEDLVWTKGSTLDVNDTLGEFLVEVDRDFRNVETSTRDLRTEEELQAAAQLLQIKGRTKMDLETLRSAVQATEGATEGDEDETDEVDPSPNASGEAGSQPGES